jgi:protein TonB
MTTQTNTSDINLGYHASYQSKYQQNRTKKHLSALLSMTIGALIVFGSVLMLNNYVESKDDEVDQSKISFNVKKQAKQQQQKVAQRPKPKPKPKSRTAPPPPANLGSMVGGVDVGLGFSLDDMGLGNGILGDLDNVAMTADTVDVLPMPNSRPMLDYPKRARAKGITGFVKFNLLINPLGQVEKIKILESIPSGVFDQVALNNIRGWKFDAAMYQGKPVKGWFEQTIRFDLN